MKKASVKSAGREMRTEYDFSRGGRGNPIRGRKLLAEIRHRIARAPK